jgi:hypothetical protein
MDELVGPARKYEGLHRVRLSEVLVVHPDCTASPLAS